jgi:glycosyltransferase involved in cell wall biosynthesis
VDAIKKQYDLVYIVFWQEMLSFDTIESIYDKLHCLILIAGVDYSQMSGGCHFTNNCQNYKTGCGMCPAFHSKRKNDFTAWNVRFRKRVYDKIKPVIFGNLYMSHFYINSYLLKDARIEIGNPIINTNIFCPLDKDILRKKYMIDEKKKYIILFGSQDLGDERKGFKYLLKAFERLFKMMGQNSDKVLAITIGNNYEIIKKQIPFDSIGMGYVKMNQLPELYSLATCFVCTSVNDAGPMMVNQSLCCGTPVVGFDMGYVKQVVKDKGTGICVPLRDTDSLADGILSIFEMSSDDYKKTAARAREIAIQSSSYEAQANAILSVFQKYMT